MTAFRNQGDQFRDNAGNILSAGSISYYQAGTGILQATYSDSGLTVPNSNPILLDSDGRLDVAVYLGTSNNYKEIIKDSSGATISPWPFDNIPKGTANISTASYALPFISWVAVTSASSPVTPGVTDAGTGYLCNTSGGSITFNLPAAATVGSGKGFIFKKLTAANSIILTPNGAETIDGVNGLTIAGLYDSIWIASDGSNWEIVARTTSPAQVSQSLTASGATLTVDMSLGWNVALTLSANVTTFNVSNWPSSLQLGRLVLDIASTGAFNITGWPGTTIWPGGSAPTITSGNGKKDTIVLTSPNGTTFRGFVVAQNMS